MGGFGNLSKKEVVGMDMGTSSVKFAQLLKKKDNEFDFFSALYPQPLPESSDKDIAMFKQFLKKNHLAGARVACNIPGGSFFIKKMEIPKMPESDLIEAIRWQMRDVVEGQPKDYNIRYTLIEELQGSDVKKLSLLAYAAKKTEVRRIVDLVQKMGLKPVVIEPEPVSLLALLNTITTWQEGEYIGLVDIGDSHSYFSVVSEKTLLFYRWLSDLQGKYIRNMDAKELHTKVAVEIQKVIDAFCLAFKKEKIHKLYVCGGGAMLPGIQESLTRNLAVPTEILMAKESPVYNLAMGLALFGES